MSYTYPEKFMRDSVVAPFFEQLSVVIVTLPTATAKQLTADTLLNVFKCLTSVRYMSPHKS